MSDRDQTTDTTQKSENGSFDPIWNHSQRTSYSQEHNTIEYEDALLPTQGDTLSLVTVDKIIRRFFTTKHGKQLGVLFIGYTVLTTISFAALQFFLPYLVFAAITAVVTTGIILAVVNLISHRGIAILIISVGTLPALLIHTIYTIG